LTLKRHWAPCRALLANAGSNFKEISLELEGCTAIAAAER
jgi:hypothetical protein